MIREELLIAELNAPVEGNGVDLVEADGEPGVAAADQEASDAGGMFAGDQGGVLGPADAPAFQVQDRQGHQFGKVQEVVRHRNAPATDNSSTNPEGSDLSPAPVLYTAFPSPITIWRIVLQTRKRERGLSLDGAAGTVRCCLTTQRVEG